MRYLLIACILALLVIVVAQHFKLMALEKGQL